MIGKTLGDRYEIIEEIGNGGMAVVYRARCKKLNRYVAIKVLKDEFKVDEEFVKKFNRESQAAASLTHPNIVSVFDVGNSGGIHYIVMELVEGITLKEYIEKNPKMNWRDALKFSMQIASALESAHRNGIIHRDIKPHNIIISNDGNCKVTDFGIACMTNLNETRKMDEGILGSVHYISPEQAKGSVPDERSDIYSLGVTMYEMLTGVLPFDGDSAVAIAVMHINQNPKPIKDINIVVPLSLVRVVNKAMNKNIGLRYQSAGEMYQELYEITNDPDMFFAQKDDEAVVEEDDLSKTKMISGIELGNIKEQAEKTPSQPEVQEIEIPVKIEKKEEKPEKKKKVGFFKDLFKAENKKDKIAVIAAIITSVIIIGAVTVIAVDMLIPGNFSEMFKKQPKEFEIPVLVGDTVENVKEKYKDLKIDFIIDEEVFDNDNPAGTIVSHDPLAGMNVKLPVKVRLVVSKGPKEITLSRYIDKEYRQAELEIKNLGLKCTKVEEFNEEVPEGYVIAQDPLPDTEVKSGWEVILTVSKGADEEFAVVPDLKGLTEAEAKAKLADNDLVLGGIIRKASKEKEGTVIDQSQPKDSELAKKSKIVITVSKGNGTEDKTETDKPTEDKPTENKPTENKPAVTEKNYVLNLDLPSSQESVRVTVKQGGKLVYDKSVKTSAKTLNITLTGSGQSNIEVYFDGSLVKTQKISF